MHSYTLKVFEFHRIEEKSDYPYSRGMKDFISDMDQRPDWIIFDDGYKNQLKALEYLTSHNIRAKLAIVSSWIGGQHGQYKKYDCFSREDLKYLAKYHDIINHTATHKKLTELPALEVQKEIESCSRFIEDISGIRPAYLVPPFNMTNASIEKMALDMGLVTIKNRIVITNTTKYC